MLAYDCNEIIATWEEVVQLLQNQEPKEIYQWIKCLVKVIKSLQHLEAPGTTVPERQKILFTLGFLSGMKIKLECLLKRGRGVQDREKLTDRVRWSDLKSSFSHRIRMGVITNLEQVDTNKFIKDCAAFFRPRIKRVLQVKRNSVKVYTVLTAKFIIKKNDEEIIEMKHFNTKAEPIYPTTNVREWFITHVQEPIQTEIEEFEQQSSGWSLHSIINLTVNINKLNPMRGSSYVDLPAKIRNKKAYINVQNDDDMCFK